MSMNNSNTRDQGGDANEIADADVDCNYGQATTTSSSLETVDCVAASTNTSTPPGAAGIKKKKHKKRKSSKGRLKKLWRRAVGSPPGITSRSEWLELMELHSAWKTSYDDNINNVQGGEGCKNDKPTGGGIATDLEAMLGPLPGPSVTLATQQPRGFTQLEHWQITEGSDHRDLLMNLLFSNGGSSDVTTNPKKKKRKLGPNSTEEVSSGDSEMQSSSSAINIPPMPPWSNIGNLASVGGVAVIEIDINGGERDRTCPLMPSERIIDSVDAESSNVLSSLLQQKASNEPERVRRTISAACKVQLFQGKTQPRCMSDVLMFLPPPPSEVNGAKQNGCFDQAINNLLLKPKQIRSEGFPIELNRTASLSKTTTDKKLDPNLAIEKICKLNGATPTSPDALELVSTLSVNIMSGDTTTADNESGKGDGFSEMEHYVKSFNHNSTHVFDPSSVSGPNEGSQTVQQQKIFALDCEMVNTSVGPELARVSVIMFSGSCSGENGKIDLEKEESSVVVLDELVKPRRKVLEYLTEYSGITPKMLEDVDTRIEQIQARLLSIIDENDILVGHSLENDLRALRLVHKKIIDTSVIFRGINGRKFSLRHLSNVLLNKKIQQGCGSSGHCSTEDAEAALILALRRARRGESFRLKENSSRQNILSVFQKVNRESRKTNDAESFVERNDGSCVCIGPNDDWIVKYAQTADGAHHVLCCDSIMNPMAMAVPSWLSSEKSSKRAGFLWANLRCGAGGKGKWKDDLKKMDEMVKALIDRVPQHTPIVVLFQSNYKKALELTKQRKAASNPKSTCGCLWTSTQEDEWKRYMEECRHCEAIWIGSACSSTCT